MTKAQFVKQLEEIYAGEDYFPGVLGNPATFAARWGLPLSKSYLKHKEQELRTAKRRQHTVAIKSNGSAKARGRRLAK